MRTWRVAALMAVLLTGAATNSTAQIARVSGTILDEDGKPVRGAIVTAFNAAETPSTVTASTDAKGRFSILGLRRGAWTFTIQAPGFESAQTTRNVATLSVNPPLNARLLRGSLPAPPGALAGLDAADLQRKIDAAEERAAEGDLAGAIQGYKALLTRVPALTSIYLRLGALHELNNERDAALAAYRELLKHEPDNASATAAIERMNRTGQRN
jgi:tetratricopeptide (TPR) repeat protein